MTCLCNPYAEPNAERQPNCPVHGIDAMPEAWDARTKRELLAEIRQLRAQLAAQACSKCGGDDRTIADVFAEGDAVWFRPLCIGYGYDYGVDVGIPAVVGRTRTAKRITILFSPKGHPDQLLERAVSPMNLIRRCDPVGPPAPPEPPQ